MLNSAEEEIEQFISDLSLYKDKNTVVLVEDREDMFFWERILQEFAPHIKPSFPFTSSLGKSALNRFVSHVSKNVFICVDSDNDAYHQTRFSNWIQPRKPFIYQTYAHSRENHFIHPGNLQQNCKELIQIEHDFLADFKAFSIALYEWLIIWLFYTDDQQITWLSKEIHNFGENISWGKLKSIVEDCLEQVRFKDIQDIDECQNIVTLITEKILEQHERINTLLRENGLDYLLDNYKEFKKSCPIDPEETLWFIQGHCAFDNIIGPYFDKIIQLHSKQLEFAATTKEEKNHWKKRSTELRSYRDVLSISYKNCLSRSQKCQFIDQIKNDIESDLS